MKRIIILCSILCFALSGCKKEVSFSTCQPEDNITQIEVIWVYNWLTYEHADIDTFEIISIVPEEQHTVFLENLYNVSCYRYHGDPFEGFDQNTIRITYLDGSIELIGARTVYYETVAGEWKYPPFYFDNEAFKSFVSLYTD